MELVKREIEVPKETNELAEGVTKLVVKIKEALKDGFQVGTDVPVIITAALTDLITAVEGVEKIGGEAKEAPYKFGLAWAASGEKVYEAFTAEEEVPTV